MSLTTNLVPGKQYAEGEAFTVAKMNQGFSPTVIVTGNLNQLSNVSSDTPSVGQPLVWDGSTWSPGSVGAAYVASSESAAHALFSYLFFS